jgi:hypothetical protein
MTKRRIRTEPVERWKPAEEAIVRTCYPHMKTRTVAALLLTSEKRVYAKAKAMGLAKTPEYLATPSAARTNGRQGIHTRFGKGHASWNKGTNFKAGGRSPLTRFKPGQMPHNWKPVGSTRINSEGYLDIKVDDKAKGAKAWTAVHRLNWIAANGPIPKGWFIRFKDGNQRNPLIGNLELVDRATHLYRNYHGRYPLEVRQLVQLRGALQRQINKRTGNAKQDRGFEGSPVRNAGGSARQGKPDGHRAGEGRRGSGEGDRG